MGRTRLLAGLFLGLMGSPAAAAVLCSGRGPAGLGARRSGSSAVSWSSSSLCFFRRCGSSPEHQVAHRTQRLRPDVHDIYMLDRRHLGIYVSGSTAVHVVHWV